MVTYLIRETWPDVNGNRLAVVGGINSSIFRHMSEVPSNIIYWASPPCMRGVLDVYENFLLLSS